MARGRGRKSFDLRPFIGRQEGILDVDIGSAVADVYVTASRIPSDGFDGALRFSMKTVQGDHGAIEIVATAAEHLGRDLRGLKADMFCKAVQEAMLDAAGLGYELHNFNVKVRFESYLRKRGAQEFLTLFLSRYVFNAVWIKIQEPLRERSGSQSLEKSMVSVGRFCTSLVKSVIEDWQSEGKLEDLATKSGSGNSLLKEIEIRLLEDPTSPPASRRK